MRRGYSLVELIAGLAAGSLLTAMLAATLLVQTRMAASIARSAESGEATAVALAVLGAETRETVADDLSFGDDSVALRAFRATAIVCDTADTHAFLRWTGSRLPDPTKDSLLVLRYGLELALPVAAPVTVTHDACAGPPAERIIRIEAGALRTGDVALVFERGSYHLADRALRWRVGNAGRQPLTAEVFDDAASGFTTGDPAALYLRPRTLHPRDASPVIVTPLPSLNHRRDR